MIFPINKKNYIILQEFRRLSITRKISNNLGAEIVEMKDLKHVQETEMKALVIKIIEEKHHYRIVQILTNIAAVYHINIKQIIPHPVVKDSLFSYMNLDLYFTGSFRNILKFLNDIEMNDLVFRVTSFRIERTKNRDTLLSGTLGVAIYMKRELK